MLKTKPKQPFHLVQWSSPTIESKINSLSKCQKTTLISEKAKLEWKLKENEVIWGYLEKAWTFFKNWKNHHNKKKFNLIWFFCCVKKIIIKSKIFSQPILNWSLHEPHLCSVKSFSSVVSWKWRIVLKIWLKKGNFLKKVKVCQEIVMEKFDFWK